MSAYPGRGIVAYRDHDEVLWWVYLLTGRSAASRRRVLRFDADRLVVEPRSGVADDVLRHYSCVRSAGGRVIVGNGDHVDRLAISGSERDLQDAVLDIDPEPDPPIHTPRLAIVTGDESTRAVYVIAVWDEHGTTRRRVDTVTLEPGEGVLVTTYRGDTEKVIVDAQPVRFSLAATSATNLATQLWDGLPTELRVALALGRSPLAEPTRVFASDLT
jgi:IMP cyclohydrolase